MNAVPHPEILNTVLALGAISAVSFVGSISFVFGKRLRGVLPYLLAIASGILVSTAVTHLLPEAIEQLHSVKRATFLFLVGVAGSFVLERLLSILFKYSGDLSHEAGRERTLVGTPLASNILLSGAVHSFVDGVAIAIAFTVGHEIGIATTVAVLLHEVPHHIANVGVLLYAGMSKGRSAGLNLLATLGSALGGLLVLLFGSQSAGFTMTVLPLAAANFLYIGVAILMPELHRERSGRRSLLQMVCFLLALSGMTWIGYTEPR